MLFLIKKTAIAVLKLIGRLSLFGVKPVPNRNLQKTADLGWLATNNYPQFNLNSTRFKKGWYLIEVCVDHADNGHHQAKLYPDFGHGHEEALAINLPLRPHRMTSRVFYLADDSRSLRFDPVERPGVFFVRHFYLARLPKFIVKHKLFKRIKHLHADYAGWSSASLISHMQDTVRNTLQNTAIDALQAEKPDFYRQALSIYNQTFAFCNRPESYKYWVQQVEQPQILKAINTLLPAQFLPRISILVACFNTRDERIEKCIESVMAQHYQNWELCIVDDASTETAHLKTIQQYQARDRRIKLSQRHARGFFSQAGNQALAMSNGDFCLFLDPNDTLSPQALVFVVDTINKHTDLAMIYADEDKIDEQDQRHEPHFKPDWNPDLLFNINYVGHGVLFKISRLKQVGGLRLGFEGSEDYDLLLRYTAGLSAKQIVHIHCILYHWRTSDHLLPDNSATKTIQASENALKDYFGQHHPLVKVKRAKLHNTIRIQWPIIQPPRVSLLIPTRDGFEVLKPCVQSILEKTKYHNYEILILDNQTHCKKTQDLFENLTCLHDNIKVIAWNNPFNYSAINNFGVKLAEGEIIGLINNDIEVISENWLTEMVSHAIRPDIGCVRAKLYYPNNTIQHAGVILGIDGVAGHAHKYFARNDAGYFGRLQLIQNTSAVTGACLLVRKSVYLQVGGLDETNLPVAFNDVDFCLKVREAGYRNLFTPYAELYHHESVSRGSADTRAKNKRFAREMRFIKVKWKNALHHDPAYNRNLTLDHENFTLRSY